MDAIGIAGLWALVIQHWVPESPYWLAERGATEAAQRSLQRLAGSTTRIGVLTRSSDQTAPISFSSIFFKTRLRLTLTQTVINFCFSWGYWGMASWMPTLLAECGLSAAQGAGVDAPHGIR